LPDATKEHPTHIVGACVCDCQSIGQTLSPAKGALMFDLSQPVPTAVIVGSIVFIFVLVGIGLGVVGYYKKKLEVRK